MVYASVCIILKELGNEILDGALVLFWDAGMLRAQLPLDEVWSAQDDSANGEQRLWFIVPVAWDLAA